MLGLCIKRVYRELALEDIVQDTLAVHLHSPQLSE